MVSRLQQSFPAIISRQPRDFPDIGRVLRNLIDPFEEFRRRVSSVVGVHADLIGAVFNVKDPDFGAVGDDVANDTAAFIAAIAAMPASGGILFAPPGIYKVDSTITVNKPITIMGAGQRTSIIKASAATGDVFDMTVAGCAIERLGFDTSVTRTAGAYVHFNTGGGFSRLFDCRMVGQYQGVRIRGTGTNVDHLECRDGASSAGSAGVLVDASVAAIVLNDIIMDAPAGSQPDAGIQINECLDCIISNCNIIHHTDDLLVVPGDGKIVSAIYAVNNFFDTAVRGIRLDPQGTGAIVRCRFIACWAGSHTSTGILVTRTGTGTVSSVQFVDCMSVLNGGAGLDIVNAAWTNVEILGGLYAQNTAAGIVVAANTNLFSIIGVHSGAYAGLTGNAHGIFFNAGTSTNYIINDNLLTGNTTTSLALGAVTGLNGRIRNNVGYNPVGEAAISVGASPFTYTAGESAENIYITGGTVSDVKVNATTVFTGTDVTVGLDPHQSVVVTYSSAPTIQKQEL